MQIIIGKFRDWKESEESSKLEKYNLSLAEYTRLVIVQVRK